MQGLKTLVIVLGVLIVVSMGLLGWGFYSRLAHRAVPADRETVPSGNGRASAEFGDVRVELPAGCPVVELRTHADRLYLRTGPTGLCERIVVVDAGSGRVLGTILLKP
jgi:hypothetical protein